MMDFLRLSISVEWTMQLFVTFLRTVFFSVRTIYSNLIVHNRTKQFIMFRLDVRYYNKIPLNTSII